MTKTPEQKAAKKLAQKAKKASAHALLNSSKNTGTTFAPFCPVYESQAQYQDVLYQDYISQK